MAGLAYGDYICKIRGFRHTETKANYIMKGIVFGLGVYCLLMGFVVEQYDSLFQITNTITGLTYGAVFGVFVLGMLYPWANYKVVTQ